MNPRDQISTAIAAVAANMAVAAAVMNTLRQFIGTPPR
jgi:hypothetical protein